MRPKDNIEKSVKQLRYRVSSQAHNRILANIIQMLDATEKQTSVVPQPNTWRTIIKSPITKLAAVAVIIVAVIIGINHFGGSIDGATVTWAVVANKVEKIPSYVYRFRQLESNVPKKDGYEFVNKFEVIVYNSTEYGIKTGGQEGPGGVYLQRKNGIRLWVEPTERFYMRHPLSESELLVMVEGPRELVTRFLSTTYRKSGRKTIDGVETEGVESNDPNVIPKGLLEGPVFIPPVGRDFASRLWVDPESQLPISLELEYMQKDKKLRERIVIDQFQWDVELSADFFEPNIPADYALWVPPEAGEPAAEATEIEIEEEPAINLSDVEGLNLLGLEDMEPNDITTLVGYAEIWRAQDEIMSTWPEYSEVRDQLYDELVSKLQIDQLTNENLVSTAVKLRELFWQKGGCISETSYPYAYASRLLLEIAHHQAPENMTITDELVESIQSIQVRSVYSPDADDSVLNTKFYEVLLELRRAQFEQIKREVADGREPNWEDFVRVDDLAYILSRTEDFGHGIEVVEWLISQTSRGGFWNTYLPLFERVREELEKDERSGWGIYFHTPDLFPEAYRYARRLPSFRGPAKYRCHLTPCHVKNPDFFGGKRVYE
jgi:hypothetical protein